MVFLFELFYNFYVSQSRGEHGKSMNYDVTSFSLCVPSYSCLLITLSGYRVLLLVLGRTWLSLLRCFPWNQQLPCSRLSDRSSRPSSIGRKQLKKNRKKAENREQHFSPGGLLAFYIWDTEAGNTAEAALDQELEDLDSDLVHPLLVQDTHLTALDFVSRFIKRSGYSGKGVDVSECLLCWGFLTKFS